MMGSQQTSHFPERLPQTVELNLLFHVDDIETRVNIYKSDTLTYGPMLNLTSVLAHLKRRFNLQGSITSFKELVIAHDKKYSRKSKIRASRDEVFSMIKMSLFLFIVFGLTMIVPPDKDSSNNWVPSCIQPDWTESQCNNSYLFIVEPETAKIIFDARKCVWKEGRCFNPTTSDPRLEPPCAPKVGGPGGLKCSDFITQSQCVFNYADNDGDRFCWWDNATSACKDSTYTCNHLYTGIATRRKSRRRPQE